MSSRRARWGAAALGVVAAALLVTTSLAAVQQVRVAARAPDLVGTAPAAPTEPARQPGGPVEPVGPAELAQHAVVAPVDRAAATWVSQVSALTGLGPVALQAYADATLGMARLDPGCRLGWTTVAAIGTVESGNGTHGGARLLADARPSVPIVGPALDGTAGTAAIPAGPDEAGWHGDAVWSHAVGPMQFLPSTWRRWASDGDGDGVQDPNDLDDAALAAGRYLCAGGRDLATPEGWQAAVLSYNHDDAYVALVLATANGFAAAAAR
ncbi:lytic transglycosylase domain-containing protein [uncultured Cellulomonas sp.]|uniref:lytic transglycosylase domain-containing protein n=1 Tax=uncultured Cellulomonas sp. TaxID=189682 RepID=UPI0028EBEE78|nr:lytic transglycosylase domain-containing protein [uncultured Cellulomonas sp.]